MNIMDVRSGPCWCYPVLARDNDATDDADFVGLTFFSAADPVSSEIRVNISPYVSRVVMRVSQATLPPMIFGGITPDYTPAVVMAWEAIDLPLCIKKGLVRLFAKWNPTSTETVEEIRQEFNARVEPFFVPRLVQRVEAMQAAMKKYKHPYFD